MLNTKLYHLQRFNINCPAELEKLFQSDGNRENFLGAGSVSLGQYCVSFVQRNISWEPGSISVSISMEYFLGTKEHLLSVRRFPWCNEVFPRGQRGICV